MSSLYQTFFRETTENTVLYWDDQSEYTFKDLQAKIAVLYNEIIKHSQCQRFAICTNDRFLFTVSFFALIYADKIPVILGHQKETLLNEQKALFDGILTDVSLNVDTLMIDVKNQHPIQVMDEALQFDKCISNHVIILMTSGSSALPKEIQKKVFYLEKETELLMDSWGKCFLESKILSTVSPMHQYGLTFNILLPLVMNSAVYNGQVFYQEEFGRFNNHQSYILISSPAFLKRLDKNLTNVLDFRQIYSAGGALSLAAVKDCKNVLRCWPIEIYGSSESGVVAFNQYDEEMNRHFQPFNGINVSQYEDGTIELMSPLAVTDMDFRLNDQIRIMDNGQFEILGRTDKVVKLEENRVSLTEIESRIKAFLNLEEVYALVLSVGQRDVIGCVVVCDASKEEEVIMIRKLTSMLRQYLAPIAIPKRWRFETFLPMNTQGKVSLFELRELFND